MKKAGSFRSVTGSLVLGIANRDDFRSNYKMPTNQLRHAFTDEQWLVIEPLPAERGRRARPTDCHIACLCTPCTISRRLAFRGAICRLRLDLGKLSLASSTDGRNKESSTKF
jgi:hypothetical protein